jgi:hypothetical protein
LLLSFLIAYGLNARGRCQLYFFIYIGISSFQKALAPYLIKRRFLKWRERRCEDLDADGLTVLKELELGTDPKAPDSDADGLMD